MSSYNQAIKKEIYQNINTMAEQIVINDHDLVYIKPNLALEPLVDNWYAWPHLISPVTAAFNIKNRHQKILKSYIEYPMLHAEAVKNPLMLGGPFVDYEGKRVDEVKELIQQTNIRCKDLFQFCEDVVSLNNMLLEEAKGMCLNDLYNKIPESLKGLVELYYDLNNQPSFRFFEQLIYHTKYYIESLQSFNLFLVSDDDSRSFVLSTPKLPNKDILQFDIPFKSDKIDTLFRMAYTPMLYKEIKKVFDIKLEEEANFKNLFTKEAPRKYKRYTGDGVLTRYFGHACILVETKHTTILSDPLISYGYESDLSRYSYEDLPDTIDYVVITHNHIDHILFETLLRLRTKIKNIIVPKGGGGEMQDPNIKLMFEKIGFYNVIEIGEMETLHFEDCAITGLPFMGEHCDLNIRTKLCHHFRFKDDLTMLFAADSCNIEPALYERVHSIIGDIDVIFIGMECHGAPLSWLYGPLMLHNLDRQVDESRRGAGCNFLQAKHLVDIFNPKNMFVYAMGMEPWLKYISSIKYTEESTPIKESNKLLKYCKSLGIEPERLYGEKIIEYKPSLELT